MAELGSNGKKGCGVANPSRRLGSFRKSLASFRKSLGSFRNNQDRPPLRPSVRPHRELPDSAFA
jgi:hypothetical protein